MPISMEHALRMLKDRRRDGLTRLQAWCDLRDQLDELAQGIVDDAREQHTWADIGKILGVSKQAAQRRFGG